MLDDVLIPMERLARPLHADVRRVDTTIYVNWPGTYTIRLTAARARIVQGKLEPEDTVIAVAERTLSLRQPHEVRTITFGGGGVDLFSIPVVPFTFGEIYGAFFLGLSFSRSLENIGWTLAEGPDENLNSFFAWYGESDPRNGQRFLGQATSSFNLKLTAAEPVPEQDPSVMFATVCLLVARRRRR